MNAIREYAKAHNHKVVGKLHRVQLGKTTDSYRDPDGTPFKLYMDDAYNEYTVNRNGVCITTVDGCVM